MIEVLKQMYQLLLTEPHAPAVCDQLEVILRQAIADLEIQEPVAWMDANGNVSDNNDLKCFSIPLYTHPPRATWVGLTDEEIDDFGYPHFVTNQLPSLRLVVRHLEAKLKEKNA